MMSKIRLFATLSVALLLLGTLSSAQATLLWYEGFDYNPGDSVAGSGNWGGITGSSTTIIDAASLTYPGLPSSGGSAKMVSGNNHFNIADTAPGPNNVDWHTPNTGVYYMTFLMKGSAMDLWYQTKSIFRLADMGVEDVDGSRHNTGTNNGDVNLLALRVDTAQIDRGALGNPQNLQQMVANPDLLALGGAEPDWSSGAQPVPGSDSGGFIWPTTHTSSYFQQVSRAPGGEAWYDEIRIGSTWESVITPEPTSISLLVIALFMPLLVLRKRE